MKKTYVLYNHLAGHKEKNGDILDGIMKSLSDKNPIYVDVAEIPSYADFFAGVDSEDVIYLCGGDGTLNCFINGTTDGTLPCDVYYYSTGTGNDFMHDIGKEPGAEPFLVNKYLENLPTVTVDGEVRRFINNVGFGIDGYCCEVGDAKKAHGATSVNYTTIAILGLLGGYKPVNAVITVDGETYTYERVWIAPTMKGRFYGGGMMAAPDQDRLAENGEVSVVLMHSAGKLKTLSMFPTIFKGEHIKYTDHVTIHKGHSITVQFDRPTALQIDGETRLGVVSYHVEA